ncbi:aldo/keto reductase [Novosphingobium sp.]|uniref:aldo/keto reductase n=1 Tax=Novosphingobium sp. TaxID=1874826 RepID=UPI003BAD75D7
MTASPLFLDSYRLLGRSGLRVSPLALGAMTFGNDLGWGCEKAEAQQIFDHYVDCGGNFIDTANVYTAGTSERMVGEFAKGRRQRLVIGTKYSNCMDPGDPNSAGNHRKSMIQSVEASLKRLGTDYVDVFYLHAWDGRTGIEEVVRGFDDLVRQGKVLYPALSDIPAWRAAQLQSYADLTRHVPFVAIQLEYSLLERSAEWDLMPMAAATGLAIMPWSPLGGGVLTGKYRPEDVAADGGALSIVGKTRRELNLAQGKVTEHALAIAAILKAIAQDCETTPAAVALAWVLAREDVAAPVLGARTVSQLEQNLAALSFTLTAEQRTRLDEASAIPPPWPHSMLQLDYQQWQLAGGTQVAKR